MVNLADHLTLSFNRPISAHPGAYISLLHPTPILLRSSPKLYPRPLSHHIYRLPRSLHQHILSLQQRSPHSQPPAVSCLQVIWQNLSPQLKQSIENTTLEFAYSWPSSLSLASSSSFTSSRGGFGSNNKNGCEISKMGWWRSKNLMP
jgi:hypothetical protein